MASQYKSKARKSVVDGSLFKIAMKAAMLEKEYELDLARRWRDNRDKRALDELTQSYLRLVISTANRFKNYGLPLADLVQEGTVGLMASASRFDPERDLRFSTYSSWWIRSYMQDYVLRNWSIVRTGTTAAQKSLFFNLRRLKAAIELDVGGPLSPRSKQKIVMEEKDTTYKKHLISIALGKLNEREVMIIKERRLTDDGITLAALGERLGISKECVRKIESQALGKLKVNILDNLGDNVSVSAGMTALI